MVCSFGSGGMAVMARLLATRNVSQSVTEEVGHQKLAAQLVFRELSEAVEPNLLDEEDMHVFGLKPMSDALHLVCCNTCKKPIKACQYASHAEHCQISKITQESTLKIDGSVRQRKPARKDRKKSVTAYANQAMPVEELEKSVDARDTVVAESQFNRHIVTNPSCPIETENTKIWVDSSGVSPGYAYNSINVKPRPTKRSKLKPGHVSPNRIISESEPVSENGFEYKKDEQARGCSLPAKVAPVPLATKIYYSQRNNRLRSALCHLYHETVASCTELSSDTVNSEFSSGNLHRSHTLKPKMDSLPDHSVQTPEQTPVQSSDMCLQVSGFCSPPTSSDFSNPFPVDQVAPVGLARNKYLSTPYSFSANPGQPLVAVQPQNGSVPVL